MADQPHQNIRDFLEANSHRISEIAQQAKVCVFELVRVLEGVEISDDLALSLSLVTQPADDQWELDQDADEFDETPDLSNTDIVERLRFAKSEGVLGVIAHVSGVKGGLDTLEAICERGGRIDPATRSRLLNVMTEN